MGSGGDDFRVSLTFLSGKTEDPASGIRQPSAHQRGDVQQRHQFGVAPRHLHDAMIENPHVTVGRGWIDFFHNVARDESVPSPRYSGERVKGEGRERVQTWGSQLTLA